MVTRFMKRFCIVGSALIAVALAALVPGSVAAQDLYKWTDAGGKVHYGDRAAAPENSKLLNVPSAPARAPAPAPTAPASLPPMSSLAAPGVPNRAPPMARREAEAKSVPVAPSRVGSACKGLADKIAAVPSGTNWKSLAQEFNEACPGIAYECVEYRANPQNNQCTWIERSGGNILNKKSYP
jgi:hypothetical protein